MTLGKELIGRELSAPVLEFTAKPFICASEGLPTYIKLPVRSKKGLSIAPTAPTVKGEPLMGVNAPVVLSRTKAETLGFTVPLMVPLPVLAEYKNLPEGCTRRELGRTPVANGAPGSGVNAPVLALMAYPVMLSEPKLGMNKYLPTEATELLLEDAELLVLEGEIEFPASLPPPPQPATKIIDSAESTPQLHIFISLLPSNLNFFQS